MALLNELMSFFPHGAVMKGASTSLTYSDQVSTPVPELYCKLTEQVVLS